MSKKTLIIINILVFIFVVFLGLTAYQHYLQYLELIKQLANPFQVSITHPVHPPCLGEDEIANYEIHKRKNEVSLATIFIKNKETNQDILSFQIELPIPDHYHPIELHRCRLYATRSFNYDYTKKQALPNYKIELWRYYYSGEGESLTFLSGPISGSGYGTDFRI
ncbi:MAG: hypothetical protein ACE5KE_03790, partial [Methanosarcinales archaeon]